MAISDKDLIWVMLAVFSGAFLCLVFDPGSGATNAPPLEKVYFTSTDAVSSGPHWVYRGRQASTDIPDVVKNMVRVDALVLFALLELQAQTDSTRLDSILSLYHVTFTYPGGCLGAGCNE